MEPTPEKKCFREGEWRKNTHKRHESFRFTKRIKHNEVMMSYEKNNRVTPGKVFRLMDRL